MVDDVKTINACPANSTSNMTNDWFVTVSDKSAYIPQDGNTIELLNCGSAYLPRLRSALESAQQSIYIAIWGMDDLLQLTVADGRNRKEDRISTILQRRAQQDHVDVRILTWYSFIPDTFSDPLIRTRLFAWSNYARAGAFKPLQFLTRASLNLHDTPEGRAKLEEIGKQREVLRRQNSASTSMIGEFPSEEFEQIQEQLGKLYKQEQRVRGAGSNADDVQLARMEHGWPVADMGHYPTHHQKMILIDHRMDRFACGFVQGFNLWQQYFDFPSHPYREGEATAHFQDVGAYIQGPCLVDLFHNFKESWNRAWGEAGAIDKTHSTQITESAPTIAPIRGEQTYRAQILRTWPFKGEKNISRFIEGAIPKLNEFMYLEDQYFRMPEFADALIKRGADIRCQSGNQKQLHFFAVVSLNTYAYGEAGIRSHMVHMLGLAQTDNDEEGFRKAYEDVEAQKVLKQKMEGSGLKVHICQLMACKTLGNPPTVHYQNIYIHAKLSIYDNSHLLLGSANWNVRSMNTDSELDIAVKFDPGDKAREFREKLWGEHSHDQIPPDVYKTPEEWYDRWDELLRKNWDRYSDKISLNMNLFPYYEDITALSKRKNPFDAVNWMKRTGT